MRLLFHGSEKTRRVRGGEVLYQRCAECGADTAFHEVEITTSAGLFFVDLLSSTDRAFQCSSCEDIFDAVDTKPETKKPRDLASELLAERDQRASSVAARAAVVEDELAALKRKLGK